MRTAPDRLSRQQVRVVAGVCIAAGAAYLQPATYNYIVNPMLVTFGVSQSDSAPLREAPSIASLLVIFLTVAIADRVGQRRAITGGAVLLTAGSLAVAIAPNLPVAVVALVVQVVGATVLLVLSLAVIGAVVEGSGARATAFAVFAMVSPVVFIVLPVLTALLMEHLTWRVVAATWALGGAAAFVAGRWALAPDDTRRTSRELVTPTLAGLLCVGIVQTISRATSEDSVVVPAVITLASAIGLAVLLRRTAHPTLDVGLLRRGGVLVMLAVVALWCFTQLWYYMTLAYEYVFGLSVLVTALLMVPAQLCAAIGARSAGGMVRRFGLTRSGVWLLIATGASLALSVLVFVDSPLWWAVAVTCLYSFTSVAAGVPMTNAVMDAATGGEEAGASAYRQAAIGVGTAIGIALISTLVFSTFSTSLTSYLDAAGLDSAQAEQIAVDLRTGADTQQASVEYAVPLQEVTTIDDAQKQAYLDGMAAHGWAGAAVSLATAGLFWVGRRQQGPLG